MIQVVYGSNLLEVERTCNNEMPVWDVKKWVSIVFVLSKQKFWDAAVKFFLSCSFEMDFTVAGFLQLCSECNKTKNTEERDMWKIYCNANEMMGRQIYGS